MSSFALALAIFLVAYAIIISEKMHRTVIAMAAALLMIFLGILNQEQALHGVDFNTLGLLIGMMVVVGIAKNSGMFQAVAIMAAKVAKGDPVKIFLLLGVLVAVFSAFLDNVTTVLLMVPVTFVIANNLKLSPKPYLFGIILLSNIGGAATLIGDPPNILIGSAAGLSFNDFLFNLGPVVLVIAAVSLYLLYWYYHKRLKASKEAMAHVMKFNPRDAITNWNLMYKSLAVILLVVGGFFLHSALHLEGATIALGAAALLLLITMHDPEEYFKEVEWTTIFFFIGLFVLVAGLEHVGVIELLAEKLIAFTDGDMAMLTMLILWGGAIFSAIVDNIPFVATMIPLIQDLGVESGLAVGTLWWALALGADIGGNATLVGASANVVAGGLAEQEGHKIGFFEYMKVAVPVTLMGLVISSVYIWWRYL